MKKIQNVKKLFSKGTIFKTKAKKFLIQTPFNSVNEVECWTKI